MIWLTGWLERLLCRLWPAFAEWREDAWFAHIEAGTVAQRHGDYREAEARLKASVRMAQKYGPGDTRAASALTYLGALYLEQERYAEAEPVFEMALASLEAIVGRHNPAFASGSLFLANLYRLQARYDKAEPMFVYALKIFETSMGRDHPEVARCLEGQADLLRDMGRDAEAAALDERANLIRDDWPTES